MTTPDLATEPKQLTLERVNELLDAAIEERGADYIYEAPPIGGQCLYVHDDGPDGPTPGCIAGHVLHAFGVPLEVLAAHESRGADFVVSTLGLGSISSPAAHVLAVAQARQDNGAPWGDAVREARQDLL